MRGSIRQRERKDPEGNKILIKNSWQIQIDEMYIKIRGRWCYLYLAVGSNGDAIDFILSSNRNYTSAKRFFRKALKSSHNKTLRVINVDKNLAYPFDELKKTKKII